ncbi:lipid-A-disaccharide synthase [Segetibacter sp. 3557_3]|uniref:lipid-A-disaccharide synthase n=1 Tax=Segetibacter sp. 3557_3 TaxID=2547429 RepID=UPI00105852F4|nr:lipid-A-disaccharide synthase [Segetibacter sp. 3557_3]TDH28790.1 lipid-A-disaccharide synthase [Segetibacter sp. 3557_3]
MKYYLIAGEASGDLHGSNLIKHLHQQDASANIRCWGGDLMQAAGANLVKHYRDLAFMGFIEVVANLTTILKNIRFCKRDILDFAPDVIVLIDYPGFNIKIVEWAKQQGFKTVYYISPQVWAWKEKRVKIIKAYVDKMLVILPFEKDYYGKFDYKVEYVGHPLVETIQEFREQPTNDHLAPGQKIIALLPGSRKQEIAKKLPIMLEVSKAFSEYRFVVARAPGLDKSFYEPFMQPYKNVSAVSGGTYNLLNQASAALVTSGTATLETAIFDVPEVVCYKANPISYEIAKRVIKVKYISLVNLIMDKLVVKELIQHEMNTANCIRELRELLENPERINQLKKDYADLKNLLSLGGHASANAARIIFEFISEAKPTGAAVNI